MPSEILNVAQITPHRLHSVVRLLARLGEASREELCSLFQPPELIDNQDAVRAVLNAGQTLELWKEHAGKLALAAEPESILPLPAFRVWLQRKLLGVIDPDGDNYLLSMFAAWYAVQGAQILTFGNKGELAADFNQKIFPDQEGRAMNPTKISGWEVWAAFLGWGWYGRVRGRTDAVLMPDAYDRLKPLLAELLPTGPRTVPFGAFADRLRVHCPELDGGELFEQCWQACRGGEVRGNRLSLMLSTALRSLDDDRSINLERQADATETWLLFPAQGHPVGHITHIRNGG
jgi:hypothetical protein